MVLTAPPHGHTGTRASEHALVDHGIGHLAEPGHIGTDDVVVGVPELGRCGPRGGVNGGDDRPQVRVDLVRRPGKVLGVLGHLEPETDTPPAFTALLGP